MSTTNGQVQILGESVAQKPKERVVTLADVEMSKKSPKPGTGKEVVGAAGNAAAVASGKQAGGAKKPNQEQPNGTSNHSEPS